MKRHTSASHLTSGTTSASSSSLMRSSLSSSRLDNSFNSNNYSSSSSSRRLLIPDATTNTTTTQAAGCVRPSVSLRRDSSAAYLLRLQDEFTVNKLQFASLGLYGREKEIEIITKILARVIANNEANFCNNKYRSTSKPTSKPAPSPPPATEQEENTDCKNPPSSFTREVIWIKGLSGCGKSRLAEVLNKASRRRRAICLRGKFDMTNNNNNQQQQGGGGGVEPYSAIASACGELCLQVQSLSVEDYSLIGDTLSSEMESEQLLVLTRVFPVLGAITSMSSSGNGGGTAAADGDDNGPANRVLITNNEHPHFSTSSPKSNQQATATTGSHEELKNCFNFAFRKFLQIIGSFFPCIILNIDDLQWSDVASLELLRFLITDNINPSLLFIGCYRVDEVDESHPLSELLLSMNNKSHDREDSGKIGGGVDNDDNEDDSMVMLSTEIYLENLSLMDVNAMLSNLLRTDESATTELARICHKRTHGNPFFLKRFLQHLQDKLFLQFNMGLLRWVWDEAEIEENTQVSGNVVDLMTHRMNEMPKMCRYFFGIGACLGKSFSKGVLNAVWKQLHTDASADSNRNESSDNSHQFLDDILSVSEKEGFIEKTGEDSYRWVHDKVQEAAGNCYLSDEAALNQGSLQTRIGEIMLTKLQGHDLDSNVFIAVNLLNQGPIHKCIARAKHNHRAAVKAVELSAIDSAADYASIGIQCLPKNSWTIERELCLELYSIAAETEGYLGRSEETMHGYCEVVLAQDLDLFRKLRVYNVLMDSLAKRTRIPDAFALCQEVLAELGCKFVKSKIMRAAKAHAGLRKLRKSTKYRTPAELSKAPVMTDPRKIEILNLLQRLATYSFLLSDWSLYLLVVIKEVQLTDQYGLSETASHAFGCCGLIFSAMLGEFQIGSIFGEHANCVTDRIKSQSLLAQNLMVVYSFVLHWSQSAHLMLKPLFGSYTAGMSSGNVEYAVYGCQNYLDCALQCGKPLDVLEADCRTYTRQMRELKRFYTALSCSFIWQLVLNLRGSCKDPLVLTGEAMNQEEAKRDASPFHLALLRAKFQMLYAIFDQHYLGAKLALERKDDLVKAYPGSTVLVTDHLFRGVSLFAMAQETGKRMYLKQGMQVLSRVKKWVEKGNPNVRHYEALLEAELAKFRKKTHIARKNFEIAIALAQRGGWIQDAAFSSERYAAFLLKSDPAEAEFRLSQAVDLYREWGAFGKVIQLRETYEENSKIPSEIFTAPKSLT